jgi:hypothetical protein
LSGLQTLSISPDPDFPSYTLTGPMRITDPLHTPVRGDLAHIRLAGRYFVPHYAVPHLRVLGSAGGALLAAARADADVIETLMGTSDFAVLDIAGDWAWGQAGGDDGPVGYVALEALA